MHFFTAAFSLFAAAATAFPTKPNFLTLPVSRDAGNVSADMTIHQTLV